jgi:hypothetical protein
VILVALGLRQAENISRNLCWRLVDIPNDFLIEKKPVQDVLHREFRLEEDCADQFWLC